MCGDFLQVVKMIQRIEHVIILLIVLKLFMEVNSSLNRYRSIGDDCLTPENQTGICKPPKECPFVLKAHESVKRKFLNPLNMCEFSGTTVEDFVVCCPKEILKGKSSNACKSYGKKPNTKPFLDIKIFEGEEADPAEFPFFAALKSNREGKFQFICGGILISKNFILTAAHCAVDSQGIFSVRLGKTSLNESRDDEFVGKDVAIKVRSTPKFKTKI